MERGGKVTMSVRTAPAVVRRQWGPLSVEWVSRAALQHLPAPLADLAVDAFCAVRWRPARGLVRVRLLLFACLRFSCVYFRASISRVSISVRLLSCAHARASPVRMLLRACVLVWACVRGRVVIARDLVRVQVNFGHSWRERVFPADAARRKWSPYSAGRVTPPHPYLQAW